MAGLLLVLGTGQDLLPESGLSSHCWLCSAFTIPWAGREPKTHSRNSRERHPQQHMGHSRDAELPQQRESLSAQRKGSVRVRGKPVVAIWKHFVVGGAQVF